MGEAGIFGLSKLRLLTANESNFTMRIAGYSTENRYRRRWKREPRNATRLARVNHRSSVKLAILLFGFFFGPAIAGVSAQQADGKMLAETPPMGWNTWARFECNYTAQTILDNARALVKTGLAADGYNYVIIDDCWMQKDRDAQDNLQADPERFPQGMQAFGDAVHALGLKFGIYEDAGWYTCGGGRVAAGSGEPDGGGRDHFLEDARQYGSWGVDFVKLDDCNVYVPKGATKADAFRKAFEEEDAALKSVGRPIVFLNYAPGAFGLTPTFYDMLSWASVGGYGQLWGVTTNMVNHKNQYPAFTRFHRVLWNYANTQPLGRFQKPGGWIDADFIIAGDDGLSEGESRTQMALWSMMSAPLILSVDVGALTPEAVAILGNKAVIAIDQDAAGKDATLVRRTPEMDVLFKKLSGGDYAVAVLNRNGILPIQVSLSPADLGFAATNGCALDVQDLWTGKSQSAVSNLQAKIPSDDTAMWRIHPSTSCGTPARTGTIIMTLPVRPRDIGFQGRCLAAPRGVEICDGAPDETWTITPDRGLESGGQCLAVVDGKPAMQASTDGQDEQWKYTLVGNLKSSNGQCLTSNAPDEEARGLSLQTCDHNLPNQLWSLPN